MRIAFFGSSLVSAYWNGAATYYRGIIKALHALGHETTFYEPDAYSRQQHRDIADPSWAKVVVYQVENDAGVYAALEHAECADLIIKASGVGVFDAFLEKAVIEIRRPDALVAFWDVDAPATLERVEHDPADPFRDLIPHYDMILTYGGGDRVIETYSRLGARQCVPVYNAVDPSTHFPVAPDPRFAADLGFLANRLPDREARVQEFFINAATALPESRFLIGGSGWQDKPLPQNARYAGHLPTGDHNAFNCSARAVLNVHRNSMARYGFTPATRVFEAAGAAACIITDAFRGVEVFLEPGSEILVARSGAEVAHLLQSTTKEDARRIGSKARARVLADHTYTHRARDLSALLSGEEAGSGRRRMSVEAAS